jgi:hypothetical protein
VQDFYLLTSSSKDSLKELNVPDSQTSNSAGQQKTRVYDGDGVGFILQPNLDSDFLSSGGAPHQIPRHVGFEGENHP